MPQLFDDTRTAQPPMQKTLQHQSETPFRLPLLDATNPTTFRTISVRTLCVREHYSWETIHIRNPRLERDRYKFRKGRTFQNLRIRTIPDLPVTKTSESSMACSPRPFLICSSQHLILYQKESSIMIFLRRKRTLEDPTLSLKRRWKWFFKKLVPR